MGAATDTAQARKTRAAAVSIISNASITAAKLAAALLSGSVSVLSEAIHSVGDIMSSVLTWLSVRVSDKPADKEHPFGHGKVESFAGLAEALLLIAAACYVGYEALRRLLHPESIHVDLALGVMLITAVANVFVGRYLSRVAEATESEALKADAAHLKADVITSGGVLLGLALVRLTGNPIFDPIVALMLTLWIFATALRIAVRGYSLLIDTRLPEAEVRLIESILKQHPSVLDWHALRTRKSGSDRHVDAHILLQDDLTLVAAHDLTEEIEDKIRAALPNVIVNLHMEPYRRELEHQERMHHEDSGAPEGLESKERA